MMDAIKVIKDFFGFLYAAREDFYCLFVAIALLMLVGFLILNYQKPEKRKGMLEEYMQAKRIEFGIEQPKKKISIKSIVNLLFVHF